MRVLVASLGLMVLPGCASEHTVVVLGEAGLIAWSTTVYYTSSAPSGWDDAGFVRDQPYTLTAVLTDDGADAIAAPELVTHRLRDAAGEDAATMDVLPEQSSSGIFLVTATPTHTGTLYLEASVDDEVVDAVSLSVGAGRVQVDDGVVYGVPDGRW